MSFSNPKFHCSVLRAYAAMESTEEETTADWLTRMLFLPVDTMCNCILFLFSPITAVFSAASESYHQARKVTSTAKSALLNVPSKVTQSSTLLLRKVGLGILGAVHACAVLSVVMVLAVVLGVGMVRLWVEEPVVLREKLFFDYTVVNPKAVFTFGEVSSISGARRKIRRIPVGQWFHVSLLLLVPESDYNRQIGVFQLTAELLSVNGTVKAKSSQPCMLRFRSLPVRLIRTFLMGIPLVLGIAEETQKIKVEVLKHKEAYPRAEAIGFTLISRPGTSFLPQIYEAEMLINSKLPWTKKVVRNWKWTFSVWASIYIYILLVVILVSCCRPLLFPLSAVNLSHEGGVSSSESREITLSTGARDEREISEVVKKWQERRRKRKASCLYGDPADVAGSSASSITVTGEETSMILEEDTGDSESICLSGC